eukprot:619299-Prymnesium_polylepis.4
MPAEDESALYARAAITSDSPCARNSPLCHVPLLYRARTAVRLPLRVRGRRYLAEWDLERVGEWLQSCGLGAAAPNFAEQMINGAALLRIEDLLGREAHSLQMFTEKGALWQMLGLQPLGHRVRFADELRLACGRSDEQLQLLRDLRNPSTKFLKPVQLPSATSIAHPAAQGSSAGAADKQQLAV